MLGLASPTAGTAAVAVPLATFFALLLGTVTLGCARVLQLPGADAVAYCSDSIRPNAANAQALLLRGVNLLQIIAITLAPFDLELQANAGAASAFAKMLLKSKILPLLDATLLRFGGLSAAAKYWGGAALALALVGAWLGVFGRVLVAHDVREERGAALYERALLSSRRWPWPLRGLKVVGAFNLLGSDLLLFVAAKLLSTVHCTRDDGGAWQRANEAGACFTAAHSATVAAALLAMLLYFPTAVLYGSTLLVRSEGRFSDPASDVTFSAPRSPWWRRCSRSCSSASRRSAARSRAAR